MRFRAVLFDVGNTLLHVPADPHERALQTIAHLGTVPLALYKAGIEQARREWLSSGRPPYEEDLAETWTSLIAAALRSSGFSGDCRLAARAIEGVFLVDGWTVFPEVHRVLQRLARAGVRLGVVSNWPARLEKTLAVAGLRQYFDVLAVSGVVGYAKPRPEIFRLALGKLGVEAQSALFVGDSMQDDIAGAAAVGMSALLVDRDRRFISHGARIESLDAVLDAVIGATGQMP